MKTTVALIAILLCVFTALSNPGRPATSGPNEPFGVFVNNNTNSIQFINPETQDVSGELLKGQLGSYGGGLFDVVITPNGKTAMVSNFGESKLFFIDISGWFSGTPTVLGSTSVGICPEDIEVTPDGKYVLVTDGGFSKSLVVVDTAARVVVQTYTSSTNQAQAVAVTPDGKTVLVADYGGKCHAYKLNPADGTLSFVSSTYFNDPSSWPAGVKIPSNWGGKVLDFWPVNVSISPDGKTALVADGHNNQAATLVFDAASGTYRLCEFFAPVAFYGMVNLPSRSGQSCVFNKSGDKAYYLSSSKEGGTKVTVLDITSPGHVTPSTTSIYVFPSRGTSQLFGVDTIALDPSENFLYVTNPSLETGAVPYVSVIDLTANSQSKVISTAGGGYPAGICFAPPENYSRRIALSHNSLYFAGDTAGSHSNGQQVLISDAGPDSQTWLRWSASSDSAWLWCSPQSGIGTVSISVTVDPAGLTPGTYKGKITITGNAYNSPQVINVTFTVFAKGTSMVPFGEFATPVDGATVNSSIPVTGWALDDLGVNAGGVKIYRDPVAGDPDGAIGPNGLVYIGDGLFVEGARPDVEEAYPSYPLNYRAGWGYMLLTNFLPAGGNGTFKLYAVATDTEGNVVTLGSKTIVCDNAHAVKPFGAIDTPGQGGQASGSQFVNFGWVLTPLPNTVPKDGSTLDVYVDGVKLGHPTYDQYRSDVAALFPGYKNSDGAVGFRYIDTTAYANGVHTIHWIAADDVGNVDGIGSRYFNIQNTSLRRTAVAIRSALFDISSLPECGAPSALLAYEDVLALPMFFAPLSVKRGFNVSAPAEILDPAKDGTYRIDIKEVELLTISLNPDRAEGDNPPSPPFRKGGDESKSLREKGGDEPEALGKKGGDGHEYAGYMVVAGELRPLPIGSTLDARTGTFSWTPGPGFVGSYNLVFVVKDAFGNARSMKVTVTIRPKF